MNIIICILFGYIFGCFSTGFFIGKIKKVDIRQYGSKSSGTTNALRTLGPKAGILTLLGDMLKAIIAIVLVRFVLFSDIEYVKLLSLYTGLGVVIGHNYPVWLKFQGGKGIAATAGAIVAIDPWIIPFGLPIFVISVALTRYVSVGSLMLAILFPTWIAIRNPGQLHMLIIALAYTALAFIKHRSNIKRLFNGTENKLGQRVKIDNTGQ
ncbi:MAG: glycerol-3-phosphate 1-O-acyltransferase PlsY [Clostridiales bacterium]|nr:glycerol-3-phosphate 1-O-acyltransferase PlsY [Clostridiales bacterium]